MHRLRIGFLFGLARELALNGNASLLHVIGKWELCIGRTNWRRRRAGKRSKITIELIHYIMTMPWPWLLW